MLEAEERASAKVGYNSEKFNPSDWVFICFLWPEKAGPSDATSLLYNFKTAHDTATNITQNDLLIVSNF